MVFSPLKHDTPSRLGQGLGQDRSSGSTFPKEYHYHLYFQVNEPTQFVKPAFLFQIPLDIALAFHNEPQGPFFGR